MTALRGMGTALSCYTFFCMEPLLLIVISVAGLLLGREAAQGHLRDGLGGLFGPQAAASIQAMGASASEPAESWWGTVVGWGAMLLGALDRIWEAPDRPPGTGLWSLLRARPFFWSGPGAGVPVDVVAGGGAVQWASGSGLSRPSTSVWGFS